MFQRDQNTGLAVTSSSMLLHDRYPELKEIKDKINADIAAFRALINNAPLSADVTATYLNKLATYEETAKTKILNLKGVVDGYYFVTDAEWSKIIKDEAECKSDFQQIVNEWSEQLLSEAVQLPSNGSYAGTDRTLDEIFKAKKSLYESALLTPENLKRAIDGDRKKLLEMNTELTDAASEAVRLQSTGSYPGTDLKLDEIFKAKKSLYESALLTQENLNTAIDDDRKKLLDMNEALTYAATVLILQDKNFYQNSLRLGEVFDCKKIIATASCRLNFRDTKSDFDLSPIANAIEELKKYGMMRLADRTGLHMENHIPHSRGNKLSSVLEYCDRIIASLGGDATRSDISPALKTGRLGQATFRAINLLSSHVGSKKGDAPILRPPFFHALCNAVKQASSDSLKKNESVVTARQATPQKSNETVKTKNETVTSSNSTPAPINSTGGVADQVSPYLTFLYPKSESTNSTSTASTTSTSSTSSPVKVEQITEGSEATGDLGNWTFVPNTSVLSKPFPVATDLPSLKDEVQQRKAFLTEHTNQYIAAFGAKSDGLLFGQKNAKVTLTDSRKGIDIVTLRNEYADLLPSHEQTAACITNYQPVTILGIWDYSPALPMKESREAEQRSFIACVSKYTQLIAQTANSLFYEEGKIGAIQMICQWQKEAYVAIRAAQGYASDPSVAANIASLQAYIEGRYQDNAGILLDKTKRYQKLKAAMKCMASLAATGEIHENALKMTSSRLLIDGTLGEVIRKIQYPNIGDAAAKQAQMAIYDKAMAEHKKPGAFKSVTK